MTTATFSKHILFLAIAFISAMTTQATTSYNTIYNNFAGLQLPQSAKTENEVLHIINKTSSPSFLLDTTSVCGQQYKFSARFSCKGDSESGIVFHYRNNNNYYLLTAAIHKGDIFDDIRDERAITVSLSKVENGTQTLLKKCNVTNNVSLNKAFNTLSVSVSDSIVNVSIGHKKLNSLFKYKISTIVSDVKTGFVVLPSSDVKLERTIISFNHDLPKQVFTEWTKEKLDQHFAKSKNPFEGYWSYLDRDMNDDIMRIGGRYTIAIVEAKDGYDLIYIDGAQVKKSQWKIGMLKGHLSNTIFTDNYNASWIDATFRSFTEDVYATFESGVILTLKFPVYSSQIRFSKKL